MRIQTESVRNPKLDLEDFYRFWLLYGIGMSKYLP